MRPDRQSPINVVLRLNPCFHKNYKIWYHNCCFKKNFLPYFFSKISSVSLTTSAGDVRSMRSDLWSIDVHNSSTIIPWLLGHGQITAYHKMEVGVDMLEKKLKLSPRFRMKAALNVWKQTVQQNPKSLFLKNTEDQSIAAGIWHQVVATNNNFQRLWIESFLLFNNDVIIFPNDADVASHKKPLPNFQNLRC